MLILSDRVVLGDIRFLIVVAVRLIVCGRDYVGTLMRTGKFRTMNLWSVHGLVPGRLELCTKASGTVPWRSSV